MTYTPQIYDWPAELLWVDQTFVAGDLAVAGGMTLGGASVENPEPGGRAKLLLTFPRQANASSNLAASWVLSRMQSGAVFRIQIGSPSVQLVADADLGISTATGTLWSGGQTWANGLGWKADPSARVQIAAAKGATTLRVGHPFGAVLSVGHVIGFRSQGVNSAHIVTDIENYNTTNMDVSIMPPLRRAQATTDRMLYRPKMLVTCPDAKSAMSAMRYGTTIELGSLRLVEALI